MRLVRREREPGNAPTELAAGEVVRHISMGSFVVVRDAQWGSKPAGDYDRDGQLPVGQRRRDRMQLVAERVHVVLELGALLRPA